MRASLGDNVAHSALLKAVLGVGAAVVLILLLARLQKFAAFALAFGQHAPLLLVEPEVPGDCVLVIAVVLTPLVFLLRRRWRVAAWTVLLLVALGVLAVAGTLGARGGPGAAVTPLAPMLHARGYTRCPATDQIRGRGRATRGEYVAEGWAQPGACPPAAGTNR